MSEPKLSVYRFLGPDPDKSDSSTGGVGFPSWTTGHAGAYGGREEAHPNDMQLYQVWIDEQRWVYHLVTDENPGLRNG